MTASDFTDRLVEATELFPNMVTEGTGHSVFIRRGKLWRTPTLSAGVLPGVYRSHLLETMDNVAVEDFATDELLQADEVWLTNAVYGAQRVSLLRTTNSDLLP